MSATCHVVIEIDTSVFPPRVYHVGVYAEERPPTPLHGATQATMFSVTHENSSALARHAALKILGAKRYEWMWRLLGDRDRVAVFKIRNRAMAPLNSYRRRTSRSSEATVADANRAEQHGMTKRDLGPAPKRMERLEAERDLLRGELDDAAEDDAAEEEHYRKERDRLAYRKLRDDSD